MTTKRISNALLEQFSGFVNASMGLHFPENRWLDLLRGIRSAAQEFGFDDIQACIQWLMSSPLKKNQIEVLACHLTVGETYFFRETKIMEALEQHVLLEIIRSHRQTDKRIRIWSAGCCTGEEAYSMAIMLHRLLPDLNDWSINILATDINPIFLKKATQGIYRDWSFRETPSWIKETYFTMRKDGSYEILPDMKKLVKFSYLNLVEDVFPSVFNETNALDLIFCRNVMMYFTPNYVKEVIQRLYNSLLDKGWLVVGSSETSHVFFPQFVTVNFPGAIIYKKDQNQIQGCHRVENIIPNGQISAPVEEKTIQNISEIVQFSSITEMVEKQLDKKDEPVEETVIEEPQPEEDVPEEIADVPFQDELMSLYAQGKYQETVFKIIEHFSEYEDDPEILTILSKSYANQGQLDEALKYCEKAIYCDKLNPQYHHLHAAILQERGQIDEAVDVLKRTLYLDPNFVLAHFMLGNLKRQTGQFAESKKYFENALSILENHDKEDILPESEGMNAGRLMELIRLSTNGETPA